MYLRPRVAPVVGALADARNDEIADGNEERIVRLSRPTATQKRRHTARTTKTDDCSTIPPGQHVEQVCFRDLTLLSLLSRRVAADHGGIAVDHHRATVNYHFSTADRRAIGPASGTLHAKAASHFRDHIGNTPTERKNIDRFLSRAEAAELPPSPGMVPLGAPAAREAPYDESGLSIADETAPLPAVFAEADVLQYVLRQRRAAAGNAANKDLRSQCVGFRRYELPARHNSSAAVAPVPTSPQSVVRSAPPVPPTPRSGKSSALPPRAPVPVGRTPAVPGTRGLGTSGDGRGGRGSGDQGEEKFPSRVVTGCRPDSPADLQTTVATCGTRSSVPQDTNFPRGALMFQSDSTSAPTPPSLRSTSASTPASAARGSGGSAGAESDKVAEEEEEEGEDDEEGAVLALPVLLRGMGRCGGTFARRAGGSEGPRLRQTYPTPRPGHGGWRGEKPAGLDSRRSMVLPGAGSQRCEFDEGDEDEGVVTCRPVLVSEPSVRVTCLRTPVIRRGSLKGTLVNVAAGDAAGGRKGGALMPVQRAGNVSVSSKGAEAPARVLAARRAGIAAAPQLDRLVARSGAEARGAGACRDSAGGRSSAGEIGGSKRGEASGRATGHGNEVSGGKETRPRRPPAGVPSVGRSAALLAAVRASALRAAEKRAAAGRREDIVVRNDSAAVPPLIHKGMLLGGWGMDGGSQREGGASMQHEGWLQRQRWLQQQQEREGSREIQPLAAAAVQVPAVFDLLPKQLERDGATAAVEAPATHTHWGQGERREQQERAETAVRQVPATAAAAQAPAAPKQEELREQQERAERQAPGTRITGSKEEEWQQQWRQLQREVQQQGEQWRQLQREVLRREHQEQRQHVYGHCEGRHVYGHCEGRHVYGHCEGQHVYGHCEGRHEVCDGGAGRQEVEEGSEEREEGGEHNGQRKGVVQGGGDQRREAPEGHGQEVEREGEEEEEEEEGNGQEEGGVSVLRQVVTDEWVERRRQEKMITSVQSVARMGGDGTLENVGIVSAVDKGMGIRPGAACVARMRGGGALQDVGVLSAAPKGMGIAPDVAAWEGGCWPTEPREGGLAEGRVGSMGRLCFETPQNSMGQLCFETSQNSIGRLMLVRRADGANPGKAHLLMPGELTWHGVQELSWQDLYVDCDLEALRPTAGAIAAAAVVSDCVTGGVAAAATGAAVVSSCATGGGGAAATTGGGVCAASAVAASAPAAAGAPATGATQAVTLTRSPSSRSTSIPGKPHSTGVHPSLSNPRLQALPPKPWRTPKAALIGVEMGAAGAVPAAAAEGKGEWTGAVRGRTRPLRPMKPIKPAPGSAALRALTVGGEMGPAGAVPAAAAEGKEDWTGAVRGTTRPLRPIRAVRPMKPSPGSAALRALTVAAVYGDVR